jgi:hypothetical protein
MPNPKEHTPWTNLNAAGGRSNALFNARSVPPALLFAPETLLLRRKNSRTLSGSRRLRRPNRHQALSVKRQSFCLGRLGVGRPHDGVHQGIRNAFRCLRRFSHFSSPVGVSTTPTVAGEGKASNGRALAMISAIASLIGLGSRRADRFDISSVARSMTGNMGQTQWNRVARRTAETSRKHATTCVKK